jgi:hypothetical protein
MVDALDKFRRHTPLAIDGFGYDCDDVVGVAKLRHRDRLWGPALGPTTPIKNGSKGDTSPTPAEEDVAEDRASIRRRRSGLDRINPAHARGERFTPKSHFSMGVARSRQSLVGSEFFARHGRCGGPCSCPVPQKTHGDGGEVFCGKPACEKGCKSRVALHQPRAVLTSRCSVAATCDRPNAAETALYRQEGKYPPERGVIDS